MIFDLPKVPHQRRHGPSGYRDYRSYKDWLRDEFTFRCVYCFFRELWYPDGHASFSVDHFRPKVLKRRVLDYDNLLYACLGCNSLKRDVWPILDPCTEAYGLHLKVNGDGTVESLSKQASILIDILRLNETRRVEFRNRMLAILRQVNLANPEASAVLKGWFGFPADMPDLRTLNPQKNSRPQGVQTSYYVQREKGQLPDIY